MRIFAISFATRSVCGLAMAKLEPMEKWSAKPPGPYSSGAFTGISPAEYVCRKRGAEQCGGFKLGIQLSRWA